MNSETPFFNTETTFNSIVEHWGAARLDIPMKVLEGFDDAAKQLITLGTLLQGLYLFLLTFEKAKAAVPFWCLLILFLTLLAIIVCAAQAVCTKPLEREAFGTYKLFAGLSDEPLTAAVDAWCKRIDRLAKKKHTWLLGAKWTLFAHLLIAAGIFSCIFMQ